MSAVAPSVVVCPRDGAQLIEVERSGVLIDACPVCRGIWLDRGELDRLVEAERTAGIADEDFLSEVSGKPDSDRRADEDGQSQGSDRKRKRGGFLENFLDFGG